MILSVSRRTDIPAFYSDWFMNRIKEGFVYSRNPMNYHQVSKISINPNVVDCIVFWTKNPGPMMRYLDELKDYMYYFQFTITGYDTDIEPNVPNKDEILIPLFQELSNKIGKERVIWRYDPIIFSEKYSPEFHIEKYESMAKKLKGFTEKSVISFVDVYVKNKKNISKCNSYEIEQDEINKFAEKMSTIARDNQMEIATCAELFDLDKYGILHNQCIDKNLIERLTGCKMNVSKDKVQRSECGCMESVEVGAYNTCKHGCEYCYANYSAASVVNNCNNYDVKSPILCSAPITYKDKVTERKVKTLKGEKLDAPKQISLFDLMGTSNEGK